MRLAPALKYHLSSMKWPVIVFYIVIYSLLILMSTSQIIWGDKADGSINGMNMASMIFLFVVGLNSFKSTFHMFAANGISRKTMFVSFVAATGILCAGMALIDSITAVIFNQFVDYQSFLSQLFETRYSTNGFMEYGEGFLWMFFTYMASIMFGFFITTAYYRMNKPLKLIISIGIPVLMFIILPIVDSQLFSGQIYKAIGKFILFCSGILSGSPFVAMASDVVFYIIFAILGFALMRRATVKLTSG